MNEFSPRMKQILQVLLKQNKEISVKNLAEQVGVSKRTVQRELGYVDRSLKRYGLRVSRKPGSGVSVEGTEENYRRAIRAFISENIDTRTVKEAYEGGAARSYDILGRESISRILNQDIVRRVIDCIMRVDDPQIQTLTENSYMGLVIHISIAVNRIMKNEVIEEEELPQEEKRTGPVVWQKSSYLNWKKSLGLRYPKWNFPISAFTSEAPNMKRWSGTPRREGP